MVTPAGSDRESSWQRICHGPAATTWLDMPGLPFRAAGAPLPNTFENCARDPVVAIALRAAREAVVDAQLDPRQLDHWRTGCVIGTSKGGLRTFATAVECERNGSQKLDVASPAANWSDFFPHAPAAAVAQEFDLRGPALCPVAACATGLVSVQRGVELIRQGYCDTVLAGSSDASLQTVILASFRRLGVLAHGFDHPGMACRPFDRHRSGFLIGEGGAVLVLESWDTAKARRVTPYAEWLSGDVAADPSGMTRMEQPPASLQRLISEVVRRAKITPEEIDYVNLHGTGTQPNDVCETRALHGSLGDVAGRFACSSLKGTIGHLLGGAGSVELAATLLALRDGIVPPTLNLEERDPECDLDYTPRKLRRTPLQTALKLSLGFGGHLAAAIVRRWGSRAGEQARVGK